MNKFREIFLDLEQKILSNEYPPHTFLPSENQLINMYAVSRETVRKALQLLQNGGYIQKKQGKGSLVLDVNRVDFPISGLASYKELQDAQSIPSETSVVEISLKPISKRIHEATNWPMDSYVWKLVRQRRINNEVVILDKDYLLYSIIPELPEDQAEHSIYDYFENDLALSIAFARREITVDPVSKECRELMSLRPEDQNVITIRSLVYLDDNRCFEYTESIHRLDRFKFINYVYREKDETQK
jgi:GntR family trehalose operon transcriptional repressor